MDGARTSFSERPHLRLHEVADKRGDPKAQRGELQALGLRLAPLGFWA